MNFGPKLCPNFPAKGSDSTSYLPIVHTDLHITTQVRPSLGSLRAASPTWDYKLLRLQCVAVSRPTSNKIVWGWHGPRGKRRENQLWNRKAAWVSFFVSTHMACWTSWVIFNLKGVSQPVCRFRVNHLLETEWISWNRLLTSKTYVWCSVASHRGNINQLFSYWSGSPRKDLIVIYDRIIQ